MNRLVYTARKPKQASFRKHSRLPSPRSLAAYPKGVTHITGTAGPNGTSKFRQFGTLSPVRVTLCGLVVGVHWYEDREPVELDPNLHYHPPFCKNCLKGLS